MKWIPRIVALLLLWGCVGAVIMYIEPELLRDWIVRGMYLPFFLLLEITLWYSVRNFLISTTIVLGIFLSTMQLMHWGLAIVLLLTLVMESWYTYHRNEKIRPTNEQKNRDSGV